MEKTQGLKMGGAWVGVNRSDKGDLTSVDLSQTRELALVHR